MVGAVEVALKFEEALRAGKVGRYLKRADVEIRPAIPGEVVDTVIDGERETVNTAKEGDLVVRGVKGEQYIITPETLLARYGEPLGEPEPGGHQRYSAKGSLHAFCYLGEPFRFIAPWGEEMIANPGDYIGTDALGSDKFYRVEKSVFAATYVAAPG